MKTQSIQGPSQNPGPAARRRRGRFPLINAWLDRNPNQPFPALCGSFVQLNAQNLAGRRYVASCAGDFSRFLGQGRRVTLSAVYR